MSTPSPGVELQVRPAGDPDLEVLLAEAVAELGRRYGGSPEEYALHGEADHLLALVDAEPAGCIARVAVSEPGFTGAEMKRVFVDPRFRGRGVARALVAGFERTARAAGAERVRLETGTKQPEAMALYESCGYRRTAPFGQWADDPMTVCYAKDL